MSKTLLKDHLLIEFLNDPEFNTNLVADDVSDIFETWRKKSGRHYAADEITQAFNNWWLKQFDLHLFREGHRVTYRQFVEILCKAKQPI